MLPAGRRRLHDAGRGGRQHQDILVCDAGNRRRCAALADRFPRARNVELGALADIASRAFSSEVCIAISRFWQSHSSLCTSSLRIPDHFAPIHYKDGILPFLSPYRPIWLGLGTVAFDLLLALVVTSLIRAWLGFRMWRAIHWLAYASWPVATLHALGTGSDARLNWMASVGFGSCILVILALLVRVGARSPAPIGVRISASVATLLVPLALFVWYVGGPARGGWAARAGTPTALLRRHATTVSSALVPIVQRSLPPETFNGRLAGSLRQTAGASGLVKINIRATLSGDVRGKLRITLWGEPSGEGVALAASDVAFGAAGTTEAYVGRVVGLAGNTVEARVSNAAGGRIDLSIDLNLRRGGGMVTGVLRGHAASVMGLPALARRSVLRPLIPGPSGLPRLLAGIRDDGVAESLGRHVRRYGAGREAVRGDELISSVEASGLTGRGGASFPAGTKLRAVADRRRRPIVLVNGAEGEPASGKDRALLQAVPHLVLDGAVLAAEAVGAREVVIAVAPGPALEQQALAAAVAEREEQPNRRTRVDPRGGRTHRFRCG